MWYLRLLCRMHVMLHRLLDNAAGGGQALLVDLVVILQVYGQVWTWCSGADVGVCGGGGAQKCEEKKAR